MHRASLAVVAIAGLSCAPLAGCGSSASSSPVQPPASATGSVAVVVAGGALRLVMPAAAQTAAGNSQLVVLDPTVQGNGRSAFVSYVDLGSDAGLAAVGADGGEVVATSTGMPILWFVDPAAAKVTGTFALDATYGTFGVSDRGGYSLGVAVDAVARRAYASVWNGILELDLDTHAAVATFPGAPPENFALDRTAHRLVVPFYDCATASGGTGTPPPCGAYAAPGPVPMTDGLYVVDLATQASFTYENPTAASPSAPLGTEPDAAAVDPATGLALVSAEGSSSLWVLDLSAMSTAGSGAAATFTAPTTAIPSGTLFTELAIEPTTHLGIAAQELSDLVQFVDLTKVNPGPAPTLTGSMPPLPWGAGAWTTRGDPHGIATATIGGKPYAFLSNQDRTWIARIDLTVAAAMIGGTSFDLTPAVTYLFAEPGP